MDSLAGLSAFVHAVEKGSYVAAARVLGVSASAVAKSVTRLEAELGVRLLARTTRRIAPTEEGGLLYERGRRILDDIDDVESTLLRSRDAPRGRLRVSLPNLVGRRLILPHLAGFTERYPEVRLEIDLDDRVVEIVEERIDLAVRTGDLTDSRLVARRLGPQHFAICGTPGYFRCHGTPSRPADLEAHRCLHFRFPSSGRLQPWPFASDIPAPRLPASLVFNNSDGILLAALQGLGVGMLPVYAAREALRCGSLRAVLTEHVVERGSLWLVWPSNRALSPKVRAFSAFVTECLRGERDAFEPVGAA